MDRLERASLISYLVVMTIIGLFFVFKNTPLTGLDERFHFFRSYQMAQGGIMPKLINNEKGAWGGCVERKALHYVWPFFESQDKNEPVSKEAAMKRAAEIDASNDDYSTCFNFAPSATYSPFLYAPSAIGIAITKYTGFGINTQMFAGRLMNLVFFIAMVYVAVMMMPVMRIPTLMILSFPTLLNLASSYSPDPVTNLITVMFIACCLRMAILKERIFWQTALLAALVGLLKMTNVAFLPFLLLVPVVLFANKTKWGSYVGGSILAGCAVAALWNGIYSWVPSEFWHSGGDINAAKAMLIHDPVNTAIKLLTSIWIQTPDMFNRMFATFGGGPAAYTWTFGGAFCRASILMIIFAAILSAGKEYANINKFKLALLPIMSLGSVALIFLALFVGFSPVNLPIVGGVQGRYFIISFMVIILFLTLTVSKFSFLCEIIENSKHKLSTMIALVNLILIAYVCYLSIEKYSELYI